MRATLLGIALLSAVTQGEACELTQAMIEAVYVEALKHVANYPDPAAPPAVHVVSRLALIERYCSEPGAGVDQECVQALSNPDSPAELFAMQEKTEVYLSQVLDLCTPFGLSALYHEIVHYLQREWLGDMQTCKDWREREIEAYREQAYFLQRHDAPLAVIQGVWSQSYLMACPEDEKRQD